MQSTGMLIENRSNPYIFLVLGILITVAAVLVLVRIFFNIIKKQHSSAEWIEAQKKLPTKKKNVDAVATSARLTELEKKVLFDMCRKFEAPNIEYLIRDDEEINTLCKDYYALLATGNAPWDEQYALFTLRFKLQKMHDGATIIHSTQQVKEGQVFFYLIPDKTRKYPLTVVSQDNNGLYISLPDQLLESDQKPKELSKMNLTFTGTSGIMYQFDTRAVRYQSAKDGKTILLVSHAPTLTSFQKRQTKRMIYSAPCTFSAAKDSGQKDKKGNIIFEIKEKKYEGKMQDISAGGCCLLIGMPIVSRQYMKITFPLDGEDKTVIGFIVNSRQSKEDGGYILHVQFINPGLKLMTQIYADVYGYRQ